MRVTVINPRFRRIRMMRRCMVPGSKHPTRKAGINNGRNIMKRTRASVARALPSASQTASGNTL